MNWYFQKWRYFNETWHSDVVTLKSWSQLKRIDFYWMQITLPALRGLCTPKESPASAGEVEPLGKHPCFPKSSEEFVVSSCPRAAFVTLDAKTLGTEVQPSSANAKLGRFLPFQ